MSLSCLGCVPTSFHYVPLPVPAHHGNNANASIVSMVIWHRKRMQWKEVKTLLTNQSSLQSLLDLVIIIRGPSPCASSEGGCRGWQSENKLSQWWFPHLWNDFPRETHLKQWLPTSRCQVKAFSFVHAMVCFLPTFVIG